MDTMMAFQMGMANREREMKVFDWDTAARIIRDRKPLLASAGLAEDFEWTGGCIYASGKIVTGSYTYLASTWATPTLYLDFADSEDEIPCFKMQSELTEWSAETKWPVSAKLIIEGKRR